MAASVHELPEKKLIVSSSSSASRMAGDKIGAAKALNATDVRGGICQVLRPRSVSGGMRKLGVALVAAPDPITGIPGVALLASSYAMKKKEPAGLSQVAKETRKILQDMESLRI